jgi:hypothetical protein
MTSPSNRKGKKREIAEFDVESTPRAHPRPLVCVLLVRAPLIMLIFDHSDHASTDSSFGDAVFHSVKQYDFTLQQERQETQDS